MANIILKTISKTGVPQYVSDINSSDGNTNISIGADKDGGAVADEIHVNIDDIKVGEFNLTGLQIDVINEETAVAGVTIDSVLLKDNTVTATTITATIITSNTIDGVIGSVTPAAITGTTITGTTVTDGTASMNGGTITDGTASLVGGVITGLTFDANGSGNSITNIEDADVKADAGIDVTKVGSGNISNTELDLLDGRTGTLVDSNNISSHDRFWVSKFNSDQGTSIATFISTYQAGFWKFRIGVSPGNQYTIFMDIVASFGANEPTDILADYSGEDVITYNIATDALTCGNNIYQGWVWE